MRKAMTVVAAVAATVAGTAIPAREAQAAPQSWGLRSVRLVPFQAAANLLPPHFAGLKVQAYDAMTNRPLAGRQIYFTNSTNTEICRAVTDTWGEAVCNGPLQSSPTSADTILNGYWANFQGDPYYAPARVHAPVNFIVDAL